VSALSAADRIEHASLGLTGQCGSSLTYVSGAVPTRVSRAAWGQLRRRREPPDLGQTGPSLSLPRMAIATSTDLSLSGASGLCSHLDLFGTWLGPIFDPSAI
jgi:hypothetical protein